MRQGITIASTVFLIMILTVGHASAYHNDDTWYPGEGVEEGMYVEYRIEELDTAGGNTFDLILYFDDEDEGDWMVDAYVLYKGDTIAGTWNLADNMGYLAGGSQIPPEMNDFVGGYLGSLHWVDSFTTKAEPKSLSADSWGRTGSIGGSDLKPNGQETITVTAGTFETTVLVLNKGVTSRIWILDEFPFPIKAEFFTDTTTGDSQIQFAFELLETGTGKPDLPDITTVEIELDTDRSSYKKDDTVFVNGQTSIADGEDVAIAVVSPTDAIYRLDQVTVNDGEFEWSFVLRGSMVVEGEWSIEVTYGESIERHSFTVIDGTVVDKIAVTDVQLVDTSGSPIPGDLTVGTTVGMSSNILNKQDTELHFAYIVQIVNKDDSSIVLISWVSGTLEAGQSFDPAVGWRVDEAGNYVAEIFVWSSLDNPDPLSDKQTISFEVV